MNKIQINLCSHPIRKKGMLKRVLEIIPQLSDNDTFQLYLNNYPSSILKELPEDKRLKVILSGKYLEGNVTEDRSDKYPDLKSFGKLYDIDNIEGYLLTIDDDIYYPNGYISYMVNACMRYKDECIITLHGGTFFDIINGELPNLPARDCRTQNTYEFGLNDDKRVHTNGMGITCFFPKKIGMNHEILSGNWESGDDESVSVWAQKHEVPVIRVAGKNQWVIPDSEIYPISPLYANTMSVCLASEKIKAWKGWHLPQIKAPKKLPKEGNPDCFHTELNDEQKDIVYSTISSDSLAAIVVDKIKRKEPYSVIRVSDGERWLILTSKGVLLPPIMANTDWQLRYGISGKDHAEIGRDLLRTGMEADMLCPSSVGLYNEEFNCYQFFKDRKIFGDWAYPLLWKRVERIGYILATAGQIIVIHRNANFISEQLAKNFGIMARAIECKSWQDHKNVREAIRGSREHLIIGSVGPSGKPLLVDIAREYKKVCLDIGESLATDWV